MSASYKVRKPSSTNNGVRSSSMQARRKTPLASPWELIFPKSFRVKTSRSLMDKFRYVNEMPWVRPSLQFQTSPLNLASNSILTVNTLPEITKCPSILLIAFTNPRTSCFTIFAERITLCPRATFKKVIILVDLSASRPPNTLNTMWPNLSVAKPKTLVMTTNTSKRSCRSQP